MSGLRGTSSKSATSALTSSQAPRRFSGVLNSMSRLYRSTVRGRGVGGLRTTRVVLGPQECNRWRYDCRAWPDQADIAGLGRVVGVDEEIAPVVGFVSFGGVDPGERFHPVLLGKKYGDQVIVATCWGIGLLDLVSTETRSTLDCDLAPEYFSCLVRIRAFSSLIESVWAILLDPATYTMTSKARRTLLKPLPLRVATC